MLFRFFNPSLEDSGVYALLALIKQLEVNVTDTAVKSRRYPDLNAISEALSDWNIDNIPVRISAEQLAEIPYPAVGHLKIGINGYFVRISDFKDGMVYYDHPLKGATFEETAEFEKKWKGITLLTSVNENSGEENFDQAAKRQRVDDYTKLIRWVGHITLIFLPLLFFSFHQALIFLLKLIGAYVCGFIVVSQFSSDKSLLDRFCRYRENNSCNKILNSQTSKIFKKFHLSEFGALYFSGGLLTMFFGALSNINTTQVLFSFTVIACSLSLYTLFYQFQLSQWCLFCLMITGIIWAELPILLISIGFFKMSSNSIIISFIGFSLPLMIWLSIRDFILEANKVKPLQYRLSLFAKNDFLFKKRMETQPDVNVEEFTMELHDGIKEAKIKIMLIANPLCIPCANVHSIVAEIQNKYYNEVSVAYRFVNDTNSEIYEMLTHLFKIRMSQGNHSATNALSDWFKNGNFNLNTWTTRFPVSNEDLDSVDLIIKKHFEWCQMQKINKTPTLIVNGKILPDEYNVVDLKWHILKMIKIEP